MNNYPNLKKYGLNENILEESKKYDNQFLARICEQHHNLYKMVSEKGNLNGTISGKLSYNNLRNIDFPIVGDWVLLDREEGESGDAIINHTLSRKTILKREAVDSTKEEQGMVANIDYIFLCMSLDNNFNMSRLDRYITMGYDSGAIPVIILTKADVCEDLDEKLIEIYGAANGIDIVVSTNTNDKIIENTKKYFENNNTVGLIGSSGVGKSTIINMLLGYEELKTSSVREDDSMGRHTTTYRKLLPLENGGIVIDNPGIRELQHNSETVSNTFSDIEDLAKNCKFTNCTHTSEPGCNILYAIKEGNLTEKRFSNYKKLLKEAEYVKHKATLIQKQKLKRMSKIQKQHSKNLKDKLY